MAFTRTKYESDDGDIKPIRISTVTAAAAGAAPGGALTDSDFVKVSKTNREFGIRPRFVTLDDGSGNYKKIPVLTPASFNGAAFQIGATVEVGGVAYEVISRNNEDVN